MAEASRAKEVRSQGNRVAGRFGLQAKEQSGRRGHVEATESAIWQEEARRRTLFMDGRSWWRDDEEAAVRGRWRGKAQRTGIWGTEQTDHGSKLQRSASKGGKALVEGLKIFDVESTETAGPADQQDVT